MLFPEAPIMPFIWRVNNSRLSIVLDRFSMLLPILLSASPEVICLLKESTKTEIPSWNTWMYVFKSSLSTIEPKIPRFFPSMTDPLGKQSPEHPPGIFKIIEAPPIKVSVKILAILPFGSAMFSSKSSVNLISPLSKSGVTSETNPTWYPKYLTGVDIVILFTLL